MSAWQKCIDGTVAADGLLRLIVCMKTTTDDRPANTGTPSPNLDQWRAQGTLHEVYGRKLFVLDTNPGSSAPEKPALVLLHGFPTSSHDFYRVIPALAAHYRVIVHDHLGFGLSDKPADYSYGMVEQTDFALMLWRQLGVRTAHVAAHDYGTTIATELVARWNRGFRPISIESITLSNGSIHIELAQLRFIQKLLLNRSLGPWVARLTNQRVFNRNMRQLWHDPTTLPPEDLDTMWQLLIHADGKKVVPRTIQYLRDRLHFWHRWVGALQNSQLPLAFLWAAEDPITGRNVAHVHHAEASGSRLTLLEGVGHYPMLEAPQRWTEALLTILADRLRRT